MPIIEFDGDSGYAPSDYWELSNDGSLGNWEESEIRTNWNKLLGDNGIYVGSKHKFRIEAKTFGGKGYLNVVIGGYLTEKSYEFFMPGHKYLRILCWSKLNSPMDPENPDDEEKSRLTELVIYKDGHDIRDTTLRVMSINHLNANRC